VYAKSTGELISFVFSDHCSPKFGLSEIAQCKRKTTSLFRLSLVSVRI